MSTASTLLENINNNLPDNTLPEWLQMLLTPKLRKLSLEWSLDHRNEKSDATLLHHTNVKCSAVNTISQLIFLVLTNF